MSVPMQRTARLLLLFGMMLTSPSIPAQDRPDQTPKVSPQKPTRSLSKSNHAASPLPPSAPALGFDIWTAIRSPMTLP